MYKILVGVFSAHLAVGVVCADGIGGDGVNDSTFDTTLSFNQTEGFATDKISLESGGGSGWYIIPKVGVNLIQDLDLTLNGATVGKISYDSGLTLGLSLGVELTESFSLQLDAGYMKNSIDTVDVLGVFATSVSVDTEQIPIMFNGIWTGSSSENTPYFGIGVGTIRGATSGSLTIAGVPLVITEDPEWAFAWQLKVGMVFNLSPTSDLDIGYSFMRVNYDDADVNNHTIHAGLSFRF
jgi:hypothetical protein